MNLLKMKTTFIFIFLLSVFCFTDSKTITFPSKDNLLITADLYMNLPDTAPFIILFHQAGWSRGEYVNISPKLNKMGFNCLAIDQRSGGQINGVLNETAVRAKKEFPNWKGIFTVVKGIKSSFIPDTAGNHGSRALWKVFKDSNYYWEAVTSFLKENFLNK